MTKLPCSIESCDRISDSRGWCQYHYNNWYRTGSPVLPRRLTPLERYWSLVDTSGGPDACWPWTGHRRYGYGQIRVGDGKQVAAHRWGYEQRVGPIPLGHGILHTCDNPPCQNDRHWFTGTQADNNADKVGKGRQKNVRGDQHPNRKLSSDDVREIRARYEAGRETYVSLARRFGVSSVNIRYIVQRSAWTHVE